MADTTHPPIHSLRLRRQVVTAAVIIAVVGAVLTVVALRPADVGSTDATRAASSVVTAPQELRAYARAHDLTGLSPAGLARADRSVAPVNNPAALYRVYRDVARYAHANGLTGLSPASLAPVARRAGQ